MNIYYAFVHSHLLYAIEVYTNTCHTYLNSLAKLNNKTLRILQNKSARFPVVALHQAYKTLPNPQLHELRSLILAAKIVHHPEKLPNMFQDYMVANHVIHSHITRTHKDQHIYRANTK
jgi:predicted P-loop ATPase